MLTLFLYLVIRLVLIIYISYGSYHLIIIVTGNIKQYIQLQPKKNRKHIYIGIFAFLLIFALNTYKAYFS